MFTFFSSSSNYLNIFDFCSVFNVFFALYLCLIIFFYVIVCPDGCRASCDRNYFRISVIFIHWVLSINHIFDWCSIITIWDSSDHRIIRRIRLHFIRYFGMTFHSMYSVFNIQYPSIPVVVSSFRSISKIRKWKI